MLKVKLNNAPMDLQALRESRMNKFKNEREVEIARDKEDPFKGGASDEEVDDAKVDEWNAKYPHKQYNYQEKKKDDKK
tara:strand:+ start:104 stop:337 length:234 start_codon:yes stop_codon:yes gene_type:complete